MVIFHGYVSLPEGNHNYHNWLVVWNMNFIFPSIGNNDPNRRTHICQRGGSTTNQFIIHPDVQIKQKLRFFGCFGWHVRQPVGWWKWCETPPDFQGFRDAACWCWKPFLIEDVEPFHFWGPTPHLQTFAGRFLMFIFYGRPFFSCELVSTVVWSLLGRRRIQATDRGVGCSGKHWHDHFTEGPYVGLG